MRSVQSGSRMPVGGASPPLRQLPAEPTGGLQHARNGQEGLVLLRRLQGRRWEEGQAMNIRYWVRSNLRCPHCDRYLTEILLEEDPLNYYWCKPCRKIFRLSRNPKKMLSLAPPKE